MAITITPDMISKLAQAGVGSANDYAAAKGILIPIAADPNAAYANPYAVSGWASPVEGMSGPGGALWGAGGGGDARYDFTQTGSGLWSIGIDRTDPQAINRAIEWYQSQDPGTRAEIGALAGKNVNNPAGLLDAIDARQRDVARNIQKEHGFFDFLGPLAPLGSAIATLGGAALGGPIGGALAGGLAGGLSSKSVLGGLLGAAGGYGLGSGIAGAGGLGNYVSNIGSGIKNFVTDPIGSIGGLFGSGNNTAFVNPEGLGLSAANLYNPASLGGALAPSTGLGLTASQLYNPAFLGGAVAASNGLGLSPSLANGLYVSPSLGEAAPISTPSNNPNNVVQGKGGSLLGNAANKIVGNIAGDMFSSLLTPEATGGGGMAAPSANQWGVKPYTQSPYPQLLRRPYSTISNQLVG